MGGREIPVRPPTFRFQTKLVESERRRVDGKAFFHGKYYQLFQNGVLMKAGLLDDEGRVEADLHDPVGDARLDVGDTPTPGAPFAARWTIPIKQALALPRDPAEFLNSLPFGNFKVPLGQFQNEYYEFLWLASDIGWRLTNLGFFPRNSGGPDVEAINDAKLSEAIWRFAWKHNLSGDAGDPSFEYVNDLLINLSDMDTSKLPTLRLIAKLVREAHDW